jgi:hypothetical protein
MMKGGVVFGVLCDEALPLHRYFLFPVPKEILNLDKTTLRIAENDHFTVNPSFKHAHKHSQYTTSSKS